MDQPELTSPMQRNKKPYNGGVASANLKLQFYSPGTGVVSANRISTSASEAMVSYRKFQAG